MVEQIQGERSPTSNEPSTTGSDSRRNWIDQYGKAAAIGSGIVLLIVLILLAYIHQRQKNDERASQMLALAQSPKQWEELLTQYPSSSSAPIALLALASAQYFSGSFDPAITLYQRFLSTYAKHGMAASAELGIAMCQEAKGNVEPALKSFSAFLTAHPDHYLTPQALFGKARCLQTAKRYAEAKAIYEEYVAAHPEGEWTPQADMALTFLRRAMRADSAAAPVPPSP